MSRILVLARPAVAAGFEAAGFPVEVCPDAVTLARRLEPLAPETEVVLVEDALYTELAEGERRKWERRLRPLIVAVPSPSTAAAPDQAAQYVVELLRRAVGYRVRLK